MLAVPSAPLSAARRTLAARYAPASIATGSAPLALRSAHGTAPLRSASLRCLWEERPKPLASASRRFAPLAVAPCWLRKALQLSAP
ncbi:MAG: hypothetical protein ACK2UE_12750 [Anaerolineales bacterium]